MQVSSRYLLVWAIVHPFPVTTARTTPFYSTMLLAWSITEVIRYSFFAVSLTYGGVPKWMTWLRYNTFFVLYPLGIGSECMLVWRAMEPARSWNLAFEYVLRAVLFVYIPGELYSLICGMFDGRILVGRLCANDVGCRVICAFHAYDGAEEEGYAWGEEEVGMSAVMSLLECQTQMYRRRWRCGLRRRRLIIVNATQRATSPVTRCSPGQLCISDSCTANDCVSKRLSYLQCLSSYGLSSSALAKCALPAPFVWKIPCH